VDALEFLIDIGDRTERGYRIRVEAQGDRFTVHVPFDPAERRFQRMLDELPLTLLASSARARWAADPAEAKVRLLGGELFRALMVDEVPGRFGMARRQARAEGRDLRLTLRIGPPELAALPWEFMYDARSQSEEFLSKNFLVVRIPEELAALPALAVRGPLRILALAACPTDRPTLNVERERRLLTQALAPGVASGRLDVKWARPTRDSLSAALRQGPWHVFHFVGHGDFHAGSGQGRLMVENGNGTADPIPARALATILGNHPTLRLAVLNACQSARGAQADPYSSTASALIRAGIPAVVAMQYPIGDEAAPLFSHSFYQGLASGQPIDQCMRYGREGIWNRMHTSLEWGTPVLHLRSSDGRIFKVGGNVAARPVAAMPIVAQPVAVQPVAAKPTAAQPVAAAPAADPAAACEAAIALRHNGDLAGATTALRELIDDIGSWDTEYGPWAANEVAEILVGQGRHAEAKELYLRAIASGHPEQTPVAKFRLGHSLDKLGDCAGAIDLYRQAAAANGAWAAPRAAYNLGLLLSSQGDTAGAIVAYRQAAAAGDKEISGWAALELGRLLACQGDVVGARAAFRLVIDSGHTDAAPYALYDLGLSYNRQNDTPGAMNAFRQAVATGHPDIVPLSAYELGLTSTQHGDVAGAIAAYRRVIKTGHKDWAPWSAYALGLLLADQGDEKGARAAFRKAVNSGHAEAAAAARPQLEYLTRTRWKRK
jgi:tetratricopeptide (TPR) repeat protein